MRPPGRMNHLRNASARRGQSRSIHTPRIRVPPNPFRAARRGLQRCAAHPAPVNGEKGVIAPNGQLNFIRRLIFLGETALKPSKRARMRRIARFRRSPRILRKGENGFFLYFLRQRGLFRLKNLNLSVVPITSYYRKYRRINGIIRA